jgi:hypothetical protein
MTPRHLESRIRALRGSLRRLLALHGCSWVLGLIVPLVILAGFLDWLFQLDSMIRAALLAALVGTALYLGYRRVLRPLFVRFADLDIAMRIEERWPGLNDRLASTIQFVRLDAKDERHGSPALRAATVRQAVEEVSSIDFREVIEPKPVIWALAAAAGVLTFGRAGTLTDRLDKVVCSLWIDQLAASNASCPRRAPNHSQGRSWRFLLAVGQGPPRRQGAGLSAGDLPFR